MLPTAPTRFCCRGMEDGDFLKIFERFVFPDRSRLCETARSSTSRSEALFFQPVVTAVSTLGGSDTTSQSAPKRTRKNCTEAFEVGLRFWNADQSPVVLIGAPPSPKAQGGSGGCGSVWPWRKVCPGSQQSTPNPMARGSILVTSIRTWMHCHGGTSYPSSPSSSTLHGLTHRIPSPKWDPYIACFPGLRRSCQLHLVHLALALHMLPDLSVS
ncbi:hypothetical protein B0T14DRAFT_222811 [Immersiella caudata]|uniref:Uncharacterized protein n=1 Tax=Immersiella caudata TaxID=314043 RepID=A0AA39WRI6_9PEZI|nr:hypothetical protein B0T14DRAFT_222811 [Immersiella caudata]